MLKILYFKALSLRGTDAHESLFSAKPDYQTHLTGEPKGLVQEAARLNPDLIVVSCPQLTGALANQCHQLYQQGRFPLLMLCLNGDCSAAQHAIDSGVTSFITGQIAQERLATIVSTTLARHRREHQLNRALGSAHQKLSDRAIIEQAKGLLMQNRQLSESEAYNLLRQQAMQRQQKLVELARQLLELKSL